MTTATEEQKPQNTDAAASQQLERAKGPSISLGLAPLEVEAAWRFATMLAGSSMVPKQFQNKPEDVIVAIQYGVEVGLPPMASLQSIAVINGRPGLWGDGLLSVIVSFGAYAKHEEYYLVAGERCASASPKDLERDDTRAVSVFWRKGNPEPFIAEFSVADAKKAGLWGKDGPWKNYTARMMKLRARGFAARDAFPDALRGMKAVEELQDTDIVTEAVHAAPAEPVRRSEKIAAAPAAQVAEPTTEAPASDDKPAARSKPATVAGRKPESKSQPGTGPSVTTENMVITDTAYVDPKGQLSFWEIKATVSRQGEAPIGMTFVAIDEGIFKLAESCEGTGALVNITWHGGQRQDGSACKLVESITAAN
jgi:hypothetical protein